MSASESLARPKRRANTKGFLRGSSLLLAGRLISIVVNFFVQVLAVRYLEKADYGAFAWALAIASMGTSVVLLGLNRGIAQFVPVYHERRQYNAMFGTIALAMGTVAALGLAVVVAVFVAQSLILHHVHEPLQVTLLLLLIGLVPLAALDDMFETLLAVFAGGRSIFVRRYVLGPGLKLAAVVLVILVGGSVSLLSAAYLFAAMVGIALYVVLLWRALAKEGLLSELHLTRLELPVRELFAYSLPLLSTDVVLALETPLAVVILEHFHTTTAVADLRAVDPVAGMCLVVFQTFKILFRPNAARLHARNDEAALGALYWRTAAWVTVLSFPVFAVCVFMSEPLTLFLFGERYRAAGILLAILAAGKYFNAALGTNTFTLQVYGYVRLILFINIASAFFGVGFSFALVPHFGAIGAAIAAASAMVARNVFYQVALLATTEVGWFPRGAKKVYLSVMLAVCGLALLERAGAGVIVMSGAVAVACIAVTWLNRRYLQISETFPELAKIPFLRQLLGAPAA